jgi:hypothetical protein
MLLLAFLFPLLVIIAFVYFRSKQTLKSLRIFGIIFSILILALYVFIKNIDLASTPILARTINNTNERLKIYYISFYDNYSSMVICTNNLNPDEISKDQFEAEGIVELWMVAVNKSDQVRYLEKKKNAWPSYEVDFTIENSNNNYEVQERNRALNIIKKFKINWLIENSLLIGSLAILVTLILRTKKAHQ